MLVVVVGVSGGRSRSGRAVARSAAPIRVCGPDISGGAGTVGDPIKPISTGGIARGMGSTGMDPAVVDASDVDRVARDPARVVGTDVDPTGAGSPSAGPPGATGTVGDPIKPISTGGIARGMGSTGMDLAVVDASDVNRVALDPARVVGTAVGPTGAGSPGAGSPAAGATGSDPTRNSETAGGPTGVGTTGGASGVNAASEGAAEGRGESSAAVFGRAAVCRSSFATRAGLPAGAAAFAVVAGASGGAAKGPGWPDAVSATGRGAVPPAPSVSGVTS